MVDKVTVTVPQHSFEVVSSPKLTLKQAKVDLSNGEEKDKYLLWTDKNGHEITGASAFRATDLAIIDIDSRGLRVQFNPAVVCHKNNFWQIKNSEELNHSFKVVNDIVKDTGISCDFNQAVIYRLDLAKDKEMSERFDSYKRLFCVLNAKRAKPKDLVESYYFGNGSKQVVFYDKVHDMIDKKVDISGFGIADKNIMRCEMKLLKKESVAKHSGMVTIEEISKKDSFDMLDGIYKRMISDFVFRQKEDFQQLRFNFENQVELLKFYKSKYMRTGLDKYMAFKGLENILVELGSIENFKQALIEAGYDRTYVWRRSIKISQEIAAVIDINDKYKEKRTIQSLYDEIYTKLLAA